MTSDTVDAALRNIEPCYTTVRGFRIVAFPVTRGLHGMQTSATPCLVLVGCESGPAVMTS